MAQNLITIKKLACLRCKTPHKPQRGSISKLDLYGQFYENQMSDLNNFNSIQIISWYRFQSPTVVCAGMKCFME